MSPTQGPSAPSYNQMLPVQARALFVIFASSDIKMATHVFLGNQFSLTSNPFVNVSAGRPGPKFLGAQPA